MKNKQSIIKSFQKRYEERRLVREMYSEDKRGMFLNEDLKRIRKSYIKDLGFFLSLFLITLLAFIGVLFLNNKIDESNNQDYLVSEQRYKSDEDILKERLNRIYGEDRWDFGIYQTEIDAYRVKVKLSDNSTVERYYQVKGNNIYELFLED